MALDLQRETLRRYMIPFLLSNRFRLVSVNYLKIYYSTTGLTTIAYADVHVGGLNYVLLGE